jgi:Holliday junction DNA helicase RuvB
LRGEPGSGKTTLARWYAARIGDFFYKVANDKEDWIIAKDGGIVILDEIHRLKECEPLYPLLDKGALILIGCTTEGNPIHPALVRRMREIRLDPYTENDLIKIVQNNYPSLTTVSSVEIARRAVSNPANALRIAKLVDMVGLKSAFDMMGIDEDGLDGLERRYLTYIGNNQPVSLTTLSAVFNVTKDMALEIERNLIKLGKIEITSRGRSITNEVYTV